MGLVRKTWKRRFKLFRSHRLTTEHVRDVLTFHALSDWSGYERTGKAWELGYPGKWSGFNRTGGYCPDIEIQPYF